MGKRKIGHLSPPETDPGIRPSSASGSAPEIRRLLLEAYDRNKRALPWRRDRDPYKIWISEIMLQQTRVETVIPYYMEWMERFPDLNALASADEEEVLRSWQGLGYYSRARNLHSAARLVRERSEGVLPKSASELRSLPGVGEYTAGAVASIAYGEAVPAVDGNVRRVLARLFDLVDPGGPELRDLAGQLVDPARPGDFNQALMELGALVCRPRAPACGKCPLSGHCLALGRGTVEYRPRGKNRNAPKEVSMAVVVGVSASLGGKGAFPDPDAVRFFLRRRPDRGLLARMWEFPGVEVEGGVSEGRAVRAAARLAGDLGLIPSSEAVPGSSKKAGPRFGPSPLDPVTHLFTHLKVQYWPVLLLVPETEVSRAKSEAAPEEGIWLFANELERIPLPTAQGKILATARVWMLDR
jgi:A/G-specific adenine glycosylase